MKKIRNGKMHLGRRNRFVLYCVVFFLRISLGLWYRIKIEGVENIPRDSAFILLPKHQRWTDIPFIAWAAPMPLYYIAKHQLFKSWFSDWLISALGGLPLNRDRPIESRRSLVSVIELLKQGEGMVVFPEGTYFENCMGPGNIGIVRLILSRLSAPFVPAGISYKRGLIRTVVRISFGNPILAERDKDTGKPNEPPQELLARVMKEIARLSDLEWPE